MINQTEIIDGSSGRPILIDYRLDPKLKPSSMIIFCHGFKGFKDWGGFNLMANLFARSGFVFLKFNFSHNGGTVGEPIDFPDLKAFSENNYSTELNDLGLVIDYVENDLATKSGFDQIILMGHSRGGGISILKAAEDKRVNTLVTLAAVDDFGSRFPTGDLLKAWKSNGEYHIPNSRTKQQMPIRYQFYEDFLRHQERLDIEKAARKLSIPFLIIHGAGDETITQDAAERLSQWCRHSELHILQNTGHTFGMKHPWTADKLPDHMEFGVERILSFIAS